MSLNNQQMLPDRVRNMRQMNELLNAEDVILADLEKVMDEMHHRRLLLHEELVNENWLEQKLSDRTGIETDVINHAATELMVEFIFDVRKGTVDTEEVEQFLDKWLPAHLIYKLVLWNENELRHYIGSELLAEPHLTIECEV